MIHFPSLSVALFSLAAIGVSSGARRDYSIPMLDLNRANVLFTTVDRSEGYLGQPTSVLFRDGKTLLAAYPGGHGHGKLILSRSTDAGSSWKRVNIPDQQVGETPTLYHLDLPGGKERVLLVTCQPREGVLEWMWSDDRGDTWTGRRQWKLEGTRGIIVALASLWPVQGEPMKWRGVFHDFDFNNYTVDLSLEEGAGNPCRFDNLRKIGFASQEGRDLSRRAGLCEAGLVTRPDGKRIALLFRPERRSHNAMVSFSDDNGLTWTDPKELPGALTGHRHESVNLKDGRTMIFMRDFSPLNERNPSHGDWVAWVGTFDDIEQGREGQYRIRLRKNYGSSLNGTMGDCGYSGRPPHSDPGTAPWPPPWPRAPKAIS